MRVLLIVATLTALALFLPSFASADIAVRRCAGPTWCSDVASVPVPVTCNVDIMLGGLGKPPGVRVSDCA